MKLIHTVREMQAFSQKAREQGRRIALVPTLGGLHEGHRALIRLAKQQGDLLVVSIFLNPLQFESADDLKNYPARREDDLEMCRKEGVDVVFAPSAEEMYAPDHQTSVEVADLTQHLCGARRPGHFRGVATVVLKLFHAVAPDMAVFGEKDYQQLQIIRTLVRDLSLPITILPHPIVRETDGLALSSRNRRLSPEERRHALSLSQALQAVQKTYANGERSTTVLIKTATQVLAKAPLKIDYVEIVDAESLKPIKTIDRPARCAIAAFIGPVRLIDNCLLLPNHP